MAQESKAVSAPPFRSRSKALPRVLDIVVVGGGMAGVMAALAAKQTGNRVLLVEPSNVLGGQGTVGGVAGFCGDTQHVNNEFADLVTRLSRHGFIAPYNPNEDRRSYELEWCAFFLQEKVVARDIDVLLHARVIGARAEAGVVHRLTLATAGEVLELEPRFVIDASGSCIVPFMTGFPVEHEGANRQLPMSLYFTLWETGAKVSPVLPEGCPRWRHDDEIPMTSLHRFPSGKVEVKMKVVGFDAADGLDRSAAEIFARRQMHSLIFYLQTVGYKGVRLDTHVLSSVSRGIGVREERRIIGEHVLTEAEVRRAAIFPDAVAVNTYHIDFHWPDRMERAGTGITDMLDPHHLPLRMMIPRGARNLLVPGRGASADQTAMSAFRVMAVVAQMGYAAGHAARLCIEGDTDLRGLDVSQLQAAIRAGGQSLDLSDYGDYLRQDLLTDEAVQLLLWPGEPEGAPVLARLGNGRFVAAWVAAGRIWWVERREKQWLAPQTLTIMPPVPIGSLRFHRTAGGRVKLHVSGTDGRAWISVTSDDVLAWSEPELVRNEPAAPVCGSSDGVRLSLVINGPPGRREVWIEQQPADGSQRVVGSALALSADGGADFAVLGDGSVALAFRGPNIDHRDVLTVALSRDKGRTWTSLRAIEAPGGSGCCPAIVATRTGLAVITVVANRLTFWHGSVERILQDPPRAQANGWSA